MKQIKNKISEWANRLNGFSTPLGGLSWQPPQLEVAAARRIISFLEDRRVLYTPDALEIPRQCVESILEIRRHLTNEIGMLDEESKLIISLRAMRASCRKFLDTVNDREWHIIDHAAQTGHVASWIFYPALGELRGVFGIQIGLIAANFGLNIEPELASILPIEDKQEREK